MPSPRRSSKLAALSSKQHDVYGAQQLPCPVHLLRVTTVFSTINLTHCHHFSFCNRCLPVFRYLADECRACFEAVAVDVIPLFHVFRKIVRRNVQWLRAVHLNTARRRCKRDCVDIFLHGKCACCMYQQCLQMLLLSWVQISDVSNVFVAKAKAMRTCWMDQSRSLRPRGPQSQVTSLKDYAASGTGGRIARCLD